MTASHSHDAFLRKLNEQAQIVGSSATLLQQQQQQQQQHQPRHPHHQHHSHRPRTSAHFDRACPLERTMSSPLVNGACRISAGMPPTHQHHQPATAASTSVVGSVSPQLSDSTATGLAYDPVMLRHQCMCGDDRIHPENPTRVKAVYERLQETGLVDKCCVSIYGSYTYDIVSSDTKLLIQ